jgi:argininosuccinate lyase
MAAMLLSASVRRDRMAEAAAAGFSLATDVADYLVAKGLPFREAHHVVGQVVQRCLAIGRDLATLPLDEYRAISPLFDDDVHRIDAWTSISARDVPGGTAPRRVREALDVARTRVNATREWLDTQRSRQTTLDSLTGYEP